ncbi:MAG: hypothetical protein HY283_05040 [Nitrospirae bacterium]|nr:hypothetical protein [Nitrospirota bacterium]
MTLKTLVICLCAVSIVQFSAASSAEDGPKPADVPDPTEAAKPVEAPKQPPRPNINVDILAYSWKSGYVWENFNKTECTWTAKVKNNNPEPRHICLNYEFLDEDSLPVFQNGKCEVVLGNSEGSISGSIMVKSPLVQDVKKSNVVALEAHKLHSFVPAATLPAPAPP